MEILDKITFNQIKTNQYYTDVYKRYNENSVEQNKPELSNGPQYPLQPIQQATGVNSSVAYSSANANTLLSPPNLQPLTEMRPESSAKPSSHPH